jgi:predicted RNase H-like HicB family nuclease
MSAASSYRVSVSAVVHAEPEGGYWAEVPDLPGCVTQGESLDELYDNLREAVAAHQDVDETEVQIASLEMAA